MTIHEQALLRIFGVPLLASFALAQDPRPEVPGPVPQESEQGESEQGESEQGESEPEEREPFVPEMVDPLNPGANDGMEEMQKLFAEIELTLGRIDTMLLEASGGDTTKLTEMEESGLLKLLEEAPEVPNSEGSDGSSDSSSDPSGSPSGSANPESLAGVLQRSEEEGLAVLGGIERVLYLAAQQQSQSSMSMPSDGKDPMEGQQNNKTDKSQSPEGPQDQPEGQKPEEKPESEGEKPDGNQDSDKPSDEQQADELPGQETQDSSPVDPAADTWGELPVHYRDIFRAEGGKGLPAEYRDWIDAYYRRLNQRSGG